MFYPHCHSFSSLQLLSNLNLDVAQMVFEGFSHACNLLKKAGKSVDTLMLEKDHLMLMELALLACKQVLRAEPVTVTASTEAAPLPADVLAASSPLWEQWFEICHFLTQSLLGNVGKGAEEEAEEEMKKNEAKEVSLHLDGIKVRSSKFEGRK